MAVVHRFECTQIVKNNFKLTEKLFVVRRQANGQDVVLKVDSLVQLDQGDVEAGHHPLKLRMDDNARDFPLNERPLLQAGNSKSQLVVFDRVKPFKSGKMMNKLVTRLWDNLVYAICSCQCIHRVSRQSK